MEERGPRITEAQVSAFETQLGARLPADYREFLLEVNGGQPARTNAVFEVYRRRNGTTRTVKTVLNSLHSLDDPDLRFDLAARQAYPKHPDNDLPSNALNIGSDDGGSTITVILSGPHLGEVWFLDNLDPRPEDANPRVAWFDRRDVFKVAGSFREFMTSLRPLDDAQR